MKTQSNVVKMILPLMFSFFIMGMVDVVGVATNFVRQDFGLNDFTASIIPMMVFFWFAVLSIPSGILMSRIGKKNTVMLAIAIGAIGLMMPLFFYHFVIMVIAFMLLGISNTILQVSLNPLVATIVKGDKLAGTLSLGQFIKAICSFLAPFIASFVAIYWGDWKLIFLVFCIVSFLTLIWLYITPVQSTQSEQENLITFGETIKLLGKSYILLLFTGILVIVGIDVCMNIYSPRLLMEKLHIDTELANFGISIYFGARILGAFMGSMILMKYNATKFMKINMLFAIIAVLALILFSHEWILYIGIFMVGFTCANVFSIIFSVALQHRPKQANAISSLMIMGVAGGSIFPPIMGFLSDNYNISVGFGLLLACVIYICFISFKFDKHTQDA